MKANYYENNEDYLSRLSGIDTSFYNKYISEIVKAKPVRFLDIGCGSGAVVNAITQFGISSFGVDISSNFIAQCKEKCKGTFKIYDGVQIPFDNEFFDVVGSFTVLEHVEKPMELLDDMVRVLKPGGTLIVACPNFYRVVGLSGHHWHNTGIYRNFNNLFALIRKFINYTVLDKPVEFKIVQPIEHKTFRPDDDATCMTNALDVSVYLEQKGLQRQYLSSTIFYTNKVIENISTIFPLNYFAGGVFYVGKKA